MNPRHVLRTLAALFVVAALAPMANAGGQATIVVSELSKSLVAGKPATITFTVHDAIGRPMSKLRPVVVATRGTDRIEVNAKAAKRAGHYVAAVALPSNGEWTLTVDSKYCGNTHVMRGVQVMAAVTQ